MAVCVAYTPEGLHVDNPYTGIIVFLIIPVVFFTGLLLVPIGVYLRQSVRFKRVWYKRLSTVRPQMHRLLWFFGYSPQLRMF